MRMMLGMLLIAAAAGSATAGPLEDAQAAFERGDRAGALRLLRPLADQDVTGSQVLLGKIFSPCKDGEQDYSEAVAWMRKYADQGNPRAQFNLGNLYFFGRGVPKDQTEAVKWYRLAAEQGEADALHNLGYMYEKGRGIPQDKVLAHMLIGLSASRQSVPEWRASAVKYCEFVAARMTPEELAESQSLARDWVRARQRED